MATDNGKNRIDEEARLHLTPMIDVTFLLLIFFMCSIKFKRLDGTLATYLPREAGVNASDHYKQDLERIVLYLEKDDLKSEGFTVTLNRTQRVVALGELCALMKSIRSEDPEAKAACHTAKGVLHGQVVAVVNECLRAGIREIEFKGIRLSER